MISWQSAKRIISHLSRASICQLLSLQRDHHLSTITTTSNVYRFGRGGGFGLVSLRNRKCGSSLWYFAALYRIYSHYYYIKLYMAYTPWRTVRCAAVSTSTQQLHSPLLIVIKKLGWARNYSYRWLIGAGNCHYSFVCFHCNVVKLHIILFLMAH